MSYRGFEEKFGRIEAEFERAVTKSRKKVATKFGKRMVRARLKQLAGQSGRRHDGVRYVVTKKGTLILLDLAPMAESQEYGRVISAGSGMLRIPINGEKQPGAGDKTFVAWGKNGRQLLLFRKTPKGAVPVAVLKKSVTIRRNDASGRFTTIIDKERRSYFEELERELLRNFGVNSGADDV